MFDTIMLASAVLLALATVCLLLWGRRPLASPRVEFTHLQDGPATRPAP